MLDQQKDAIQNLIVRALAALDVADVVPQLEKPKDPTHGDVACTVAMQLARRLKKNPRAIAETLVAEMRADEAFAALLETVEIAGPGFINFRVAQNARAAIVSQVLQAGEKFGRSNEFAGKSVLLEYVSANPTGPLHLGHARQGALGDVLANLLDSQGWKVSREFYYNDAGVQIGNLAMSVQVRCRQLQGESLELPENAYHGEYIVSIARDFLDKKPVIPHGGEPIESSGDYGDTDLVRRYSVAYLRNEQDDDLSALGVRFDNFFLESSLYTTGAVQKTVQAIIDAGYTYEADNALWLRTTAFEDLGNGLRDDKDRVMKKSDGTYTYFVPDVAYHLNKFSRGYKAGKFRASSITTTPVCRLAISPCPYRFAAVSCKANLWSFRKTPITANTSSLSHAIFWIKNPSFRMAVSLLNPAETTATLIWCAAIPSPICAMSRMTIFRP